MNRGRFIGLASSLPVLLLGGLRAAAGEAKPSGDAAAGPAPTPPKPTTCAPADSTWAARWKAAAAVKAAREVGAKTKKSTAPAVQLLPYPDVAPKTLITTTVKAPASDPNSDWAQRWKAAAEARRATAKPATPQPKKAAPPERSPSRDALPKPPSLAAVASTSEPSPSLVRTQQLMTLAQRRRPGRPAPAEAEAP